MIERRIPTTAQIINAEQARATGYYTTAREQVRGIMGFPLDGFSRRALSEQQRFLAAARISASSSMSLAREQSEAPDVARELAQARSVIVDIYDNSEVKTAVSGLKTGIQGEPYEYATEMRRDKISYTLTLAALTGNSALLEAAITEMDAAIAEAEEPTAKTLLQFDRQRLRHHQSPSDDSFAELTRTFIDATNASIEAKNWERAATIAARYIVDAEDFNHSTGNIFVDNKGYIIYDRAVKGNSELAEILGREKRKKKEEKSKHARWRSTCPEGVDYSHLAL